MIMHQQCYARSAHQFRAKLRQSTMTSMPLQTSLQVRKCYVLLHAWQNKQVLTD